MNVITTKTFALSGIRDKIEFSGFETVLFNKEMTSLINCPNIASGRYVIPQSVESIGIEAFAQCKEITTVIFPESLKKIGCLAFESCISIVTITIPYLVKEIGYRAFSNCTGLKSICVQAENPIRFKKESEVFHNVDKTACVLNVPYGSKTEYQQADQWKDFSVIIEKETILDLSISN
jgi:hypothetical protein